MTEETTSNKELLDKLASTVSRLRDDVHMVKTEMAKFKQAVQFDIERLVEIREKDVEQIRNQFQKQK
jgi:predicted  nucleic acid-binding Zn-ribbon protein